MPHESIEAVFLAFKGHEEFLPAKAGGYLNVSNENLVILKRMINWLSNESGEYLRRDVGYISRNMDIPKSIKMLAQRIVDHGPGY